MNVELGPDDSHRRVACVDMRRIADPKDRERFVALVREAMAGSIKKGEPPECPPA